MCSAECVLIPAVMDAPLSGAPQQMIPALAPGAQSARILAETFAPQAELTPQERRAEGRARRDPPPQKSTETESASWRRWRQRTTTSLYVVSQKKMKRCTLPRILVPIRVARLPTPPPHSPPPLGRATTKRCRFSPANAT
jgi:hypothetical protein